MNSSKSTVYPRTTANDDHKPLSVDGPLVIASGRSSSKSAQQLSSETVSESNQVTAKNQRSRDSYEIKQSETIVSLLATINDFRMTMLVDDPLLITYGRSGSKPAQQLLFEAAAASTQIEAETKWNTFEKKVEHDRLQKREIQKLIHNLDERKQWPALHYAVSKNNTFVAKILLGTTDLREKGSYECNIKILGGHGENALHVAAQSRELWNTNQSQNTIRSNNTNSNLVAANDLSSSNQQIPYIVEELTRRFKPNFQIDQVDDEGRTPLHLAVIANRCNFASYLLENGANIKARTTMNENVFHFMFIPSDPLQTAENLKYMFDLLHTWYNKTGKRNKLDLLTSPTVDNRSPLAFALSHAFDFATKRKIIEEQLSLLEPFMDRITKYSDQKNQLIHMACRHNHVDMLKWFIDKRGFDRNDINAKNNAGYTPLLTAAFYEANECFKYLLKIDNIEWTERNDDGETVLHILAKSESGLDLVKMIDKEPRFKNMQRVMMTPDNAGNTPLHTAVCSNQLEICKQLVIIAKYNTKSSAVINIIDKKNDLGQTAVYVACEKGYEGIVKFFYDMFTKKDSRDNLFKQGDNDRQSCLHLAAANNHLKVVKYLVETVEMDVDIIADRRITPLHLACQYDRLEVAEYLLEHNASPILRNAQLYNCLEIAIMNGRDKLVKDILFEHPLWRSMMRNAQPIKEIKAYDTPMRKLIRYMPNVALHVIDTKLTRTVGGEGQKVFKKIYDYEFYQDEFTVEQWYRQGSAPGPLSYTCRDRFNRLTGSEKVRCAFCCYCCMNNNNDDTHHKPYSNNSYILVRNHPLFIASQQSSCPKLIDHPYNMYLRKTKFRMFGNYLLVLSFLLYSTYLGIFTALMLQAKHPQYFYDLINVTYSEDPATCERVSNTLVNANVTEVFKPDSYRRLRWVSFAFLYVFIVKNILIVISLFPKILRLGASYLEMAVLGLSFISIWDWYPWLSPVIFRCPVQYQIGSISLLLAWINFLTYVRYVAYGHIGIYVVMLQCILLKFIEFLPVLMIIVCGFGFSFWMLLQNQDVYGTPIEALIRTSLMIFDLNYEDRLYGQSDGNFAYYAILYLIFILTGIVLCIFVVNLMISVAVGEIPSLKEQSIAWRHKMIYNVLSDYEILRYQIRHLVDCVTCGFLNRTEGRGPRIFKFLQRHQDLIMQEDEKNVFYLIRFGRYVQKHFFRQQIQDNVEIRVDRDQLEEK
ncbi:hypothetical protein I4U23_016789 [Adineta vaga]|nr:hypothetical protein I4U23_016789 [Adineta vaga]